MTTLKRSPLIIGGCWKIKYKSGGIDTDENGGQSEQQRRSKGITVVAYSIVV